MKAFMYLGAAAAVALAGPALAANLVTNGGFETGAFSPWALSNIGGGTAPVVIPFNSGSTYPGGAYGEPIPQSPGGGNYAAYFSSDTANPDSLTQSVNVVGGTTYSLSFDYYIPLNGFNNPNDATLAFLIDGAAAGSSLVAGSAPGTAQTWYNFSTNWTAGSTGAVDLTFQFFGNGVTAADFVVDNVSMAAVPEPATWAMMIGGFALAGMAMRRRKTSVSFA